jgi:hypothetical protein
MRLKLASSIVALVAGCAAILGALGAPSVRADEWNRETIVTFHEDVQVPGTVLPAGTYVFKLADSDSNRNIVQIFNADGTRLITTILAINDYRREASGKPIISFAERPVGQPEAVRAWFYPGDDHGLEFVYPRRRASELANANHEPVLATPTANVPATTTETVAPVAPATPTLKSRADKHESPKPDTNAAATQELPHTASPVPTIALGGILLLFGAFTMRRLLSTAA